ncbi:MAG TPA: hypothetical protein VMT34_12040 [Aggregatilineales bacterium]|nr:hypothetical protein [Aggregatilineales bacterium]
MVFSHVPPFAVAAGNHARIMRFRFSRPIVERLLRIAWWHWPALAALSNVEWFYKPIAEFVGHFDPEGVVPAMNELIQIIQDELDIGLMIAPDTALISGGIIDCFHFVGLLNVLEDHHKVRIEVAGVGADNFDTPEQLFRYIQTQKIG